MNKASHMRDWFKTTALVIILLVMIPVGLIGSLVLGFINAFSEWIGGIIWLCEMIRDEFRKEINK